MAPNDRQENGRTNGDKKCVVRQSFCEWGHIHTRARIRSPQSIEIFGMLVTAVTTLIKSYAGGAEEYLIFFIHCRLYPCIDGIHYAVSVKRFRVSSGMCTMRESHCSAFGVVIGRFGVDLKDIKALTASFVGNERSGCSGNTQK